MATAAAAKAKPAKKEKLPDTFLWDGKDKKGNKIKGETSGTSIATVRADLRRQGINPTKVRKKPKPLFGSSVKPATTADIALASRQLATMLATGIPLVQAFEIIGNGSDSPGVRDLMLKIKVDIESGISLSQALAKHPAHFDDLYCSLVAAGEAAGILDNLLDKIATYKEKTESIKKKIKKALTYPIAVIVVAFIVSAILLIFVVPQFKQMFEGFGGGLPAFTQMLVDLSEWMQGNWYIVVAAVIVGGFSFGQAKKRSVAFNHFMDRLMLKLPVIGVIQHKAAIARFARTLSTMFAAGVPLVDALESVSGATGNIVYTTAVREMKEQVSTGTQLQASMKAVQLFPNMVVQMVAIGEESGALDQMLSKVADFYEEEVDNAVDSMSSLMEPFIMAVLGVLVGGMVIGMYLPIFKMGSIV